METTNIKFHFQLRKSCCGKLKDFLQISPLVRITKPSFSVVRIHKFIYTCYKNGFINVTGVRHLDTIVLAINILKDEIGFESEDQFVVDSISSRYIATTKRRISIPFLLQEIRKEFRLLSIKYNRERFPGMFIKTSYGTIIWFPSNSVVCVGSKSQEDLTQIADFIDNFYNRNVML